MNQIEIEQNEDQEVQIVEAKNTNIQQEDDPASVSQKSQQKIIKGAMELLKYERQKKNKQQAILIEDSEVKNDLDKQQENNKIIEWPKCELCQFKLFQGICIDAKCPQQDQMLLVCLECHKKDHLRCVTLLEYSEKIIFSEEIRELLRYKKSRHLNMLESSQELINGNPNLMCNKLIDTLQYYRKSIERLYDLDKNYQKTNIWRKEQVRQVCLNLDNEQSSYQPLQIQFLEFILGFHEKTIRNFVVKNQRSQQAYDIETIYLDRAKVAKPPISLQGTSVVINLTQSNQENKDNPSKDVQIIGEQVVISENEETNKNSKQKKGSKLLVVDINESENKLKELLNPSEDKLRELSEKERQKREKNAQKIKKDLFLEKSSLYQQQRALKRENSMNIQDFFKQKEKNQIISDDKVTRSKLKEKVNTTQDVDKQQNKSNKNSSLEQLNSDQIKQEDISKPKFGRPLKKSNSLEVQQEEVQHPRRGRPPKSQYSEEKSFLQKQNPKRGRKKKQQIDGLEDDEDYDDDKSIQEEAVTQELDLKQFNYQKKKQNTSILDFFTPIQNTQLKINVKQEDNENKKQETYKNTHNHNSEMDIENNDSNKLFTQQLQREIKKQSNQDGVKSPTNSSFSKDFVTKIEYDRVPYFRQNNNNDLEQEIDIILDDEDDEEEEQENKKKRDDQQNILKQMGLNDYQNSKAESEAKYQNSFQEKENSKMIDEENIINEQTNSNQNQNKNNPQFLSENSQNKFQKNTSKESQFADELEDDFYDYYNEFKKSPSISNMYAEDSFLSTHKIQLNTRIKRVFYEDFYLGQSSETEQEENKSNAHQENKDEIQQVQSKKSQIRCQYQHFEYLNQYLDDEELTDRIIKTPIQSDAVRLYFNFEGNYTSIQSVKALEEILPKYELLNELCINLRNCFIWMELEILGRNLRLLKKLSKLSLNLSKTQIEIQHLFGLVKHLNKITSLHSLNIDLSENSFKNIDNHSLSIIGLEELQIPEVSLHIDDFDLEQDSTQIILNVFCRKNKRLNKLYLVNYGDMNKIHLVNFICFLVKRQRINEVVLRINITELKKKRLAEIISACQSSQSLAKLGFELIGKISPSVMEEFSLIGEHCKSLVHFYIDISDLENDDQQLLSFIRCCANNCKTNKKYVISMRGRNIDKEIKDAISKIKTKTFVIVF